MKALVKKYNKPGLWLDEVPVPEPGINDVLIKIQKTAICGTDVHIYNWDQWAQKTIKTPLTIGHEYVGLVAGFGNNVHDLEVGEVVSGEGHIVCGHCRNCLAGKRHLCPNTLGVGVHRDGAYAEYLCIPRSNVWVCDPSLPSDIIACFDPFGNAIHTALTFDVLGEDVLITGAGPIGIMAIPVVKHAGARNVVITDVNPYRLELAKKMNPTRVVDVSKENLPDVMKELNMKEGFDVGLEMSGNDQALQDMIHNMFNGGKIALLGIPSKDTLIDWNAIIFESLTIKGIYGRMMFETWYKMTAVLQSGVDITPVITHRFPCENYMEAFELMKSGYAGKVILNWEE